MEYLMEDKRVVDGGLIWRVRDGKNIDVAMDFWIKVYQISPYNPL